MRNSWIIALRELKERINHRSFLYMSLLGPIMVIFFIYLLFTYAGSDKQRYNVLIADPTGLFENRIYTDNQRNIEYSFVNQYVEMENFKLGKRYQQFDALVEVNEKILSNKVSHVFYRDKPSVRFQTTIRYNLERRLEELLVGKFTKFTVQDFRRIKQPLSVAFRDVNDPMNEASDLRGWVGYFFGCIIVLFIALFGMNILRSVSSEKSNRIVEVILAAVPARQFMFGKILGMGMAAFMQFFIWALLIGAGLFYLRENVFIDFSDASNWEYMQMAEQVKQSSSLFSAIEYNEFVELVYDRINFDIMVFYFLLFFIAAYFFYAAFFAGIGATSGSENDGQQYVLPLLALLVLALVAGYLAIYYPDSTLTAWTAYIPFTSPVVVMVKLAHGYLPGQGYQLFVSLGILALSAFVMLQMASRWYKNGLLRFGHRLKIWHLFKMLKN